LYKSYQENLSIYEKTGESKDKLAESAKNLAEAYGIEGAALAALSGDYTKLTEAINESRSAELKELTAATEHSIALNKEVYEKAMRGGRGHKRSDGTYTVRFRDGGLGGAQS
jgi:hypothetical protein